MEVLPVLDAHIHLDPAGDPKGAVRRFLNAGGSHLVVVHKPYSGDPILDIKGYETAYRTTLEMKELAIGCGVKAECVLGPYPGEIPIQCSTLGPDAALSLQLSAVELVAELVASGEAMGIGEVGRVHFPTSSDVLGLCDKVLLRSMEAARKLDAPIVLHTESLHVNADLISHIAELSVRAGLKRERVVKHYSDPTTVREAFSYGLSSSMLCRRSYLSEVLVNGTYPLLETDFVDDPSRPNVVMPPDTVPKKVKWAREQGLLDDDGHYELMVNAPMKAYGLDTTSV